MKRGEEAERQRLDEEQGFEQDEGPPLVDPVGHHAAVEGEQEHRQGAQRGDEADLERRVRELERQPPERHQLHPGAAERDELADDEEPEVPVSEGAERGAGGRHVPT